MNMKHCKEIHRAWQLTWTMQHYSTNAKTQRVAEVIKMGLHIWTNTHIFKCFSTIFLFGAQELDMKCLSLSVSLLHPLTLWPSHFWVMKKQTCGKLQQAPSLFLFYFMTLTYFLVGASIDICIIDAVQRRLWHIWNTCSVSRCSPS